MTQGIVSEIPFQSIMSSSSLISAESWEMIEKKVIDYLKSSTTIEEIIKLVDEDTTQNYVKYCINWMPEDATRQYRRESIRFHMIVKHIMINHVFDYIRRKYDYLVLAQEVGFLEE